MNIHAKASPTGTMSPAEWQARVDLAAVYRLVAQHGWDDVIYNHCSMRVPGEQRKLLMKRHELLWTEVTASNILWKWRLRSGASLFRSNDSANARKAASRSASEGIRLLMIPIESYSFNSGAV